MKCYKLAWLQKASIPFGLISIAAFLSFGNLGAQVPPMKPAINFKETSRTVNEKVGTITLEVVLTNSYPDTVTVQYATADNTATAPSDYKSKSGTLTFTSGVTSQTIEIEIIDDGTGEQTEWFSVNLSNATNGIAGGPCLVTIQDGAGPAVVSFEYAGWTYNEADGTATITVMLTGSPTGKVTVDFATSEGTATAGTDYVATSGTLTWQTSEGGTSKSFTITLLDDSFVEWTETVNLTLSNPVNATLGAQDTAVLDILDDDIGCGSP
jgi:hypothetical protein